MSTETLIAIITACRGDDEWTDIAVVQAARSVEHLDDDDYDTLRRWIRVQPPYIHRRLADALSEGPATALPLLEDLLNAAGEPADVRLVADAIRHLLRKNPELDAVPEYPALDTLRDLKEGGDEYAGEILADLLSHRKAITP